MFWNNSRDAFLKEVEDFMVAGGCRPSGARIYLGKIRHFLDNGFSVNDLCGAIDQLIEQYSRGGSKYDPADHNNISSALKQVRRLLRQKLLERAGAFSVSYDMGWQSFRPQDPHVTGYCIDGDTMTVQYSDFGHSETRQLSFSQLRELVDLLNLGKNMGTLSRSNTAVTTVHGPIHSYAYEFQGESGCSCGGIFKDECLQAGFSDLIHRILA